MEGIVLESVHLRFPKCYFLLIDLLVIFEYNSMFLWSVGYLEASKELSERTCSAKLGVLAAKWPSLFLSAQNGSQKGTHNGSPSFFSDRFARCHLGPRLGHLRFTIDTKKYD